MIGNSTLSNSGEEQQQQQHQKKLPRIASIPDDDIFLSDVYMVLFKNGLYSNATVMINNITYRVHKEIVSHTSGLFASYFYSGFDIQSHHNIEVKDLDDKIASPEIIDTVFKILYNSYASIKNSSSDHQHLDANSSDTHNNENSTTTDNSSSCNDSDSTVNSSSQSKGSSSNTTFKLVDPITRENLLERLNIHYILRFFCFNFIDEYDIPLNVFKENFNVLFERISGIYDTIYKHRKGDWKSNIPTRDTTESVELLNQFLTIFRGKTKDKLLQWDTKVILYNGLRYNIQDNEFWLTYLYVNVTAPFFGLNAFIYPSEAKHHQHYHYPIRLPLIRKVKKIPNLNLNCLRNLLVIDEHLLFLAMLIDFEGEVLKHYNEIFECPLSSNTHTLQDSLSKMGDLSHEEKLKAAETSFVTQCQLMFPHQISHYILSLFFTSNALYQSKLFAPQPNASTP
ncbi:hypothetical protein C9374_014604 [Naegleria lovaniensis]|uniref:BTB domain-containing protein n=1 Tax=Naegleria lovaniensis TaxID=51637 RepID=A0AA88H0B3_NAELO|nr:uncharacterized protein C9374_014604 [Naegleria lovaniensis]KAG2389204.1 hypothetical protein C9374_014604 [Naegleria lovaniensis]